jgi:hypothetical protein
VTRGEVFETDGAVIPPLLPSPVPLHLEAFADLTAACGVVRDTRARFGDLLVFHFLLILAAVLAPAGCVVVAVLTDATPSTVLACAAYSPVLDLAPSTVLACAAQLTQFVTQFITQND